MLGVWTSSGFTGIMWDFIIKKVIYCYPNYIKSYSVKGYLCGRFLLQVTGRISLFYQYRKYPKHLLKLTLGLIRSKNTFFKAKVSF